MVASVAQWHDIPLSAVRIRFHYVGAHRRGIEASLTGAEYKTSSRLRFPEILPGIITFRLVIGAAVDVFYFDHIVSPF